MWKRLVIREGSLRRDVRAPIKKSAPASALPDEVEKCVYEGLRLFPVNRVTDPVNQSQSRIRILSREGLLFADGKHRVARAPDDERSHAGAW